MRWSCNRPGTQSERDSYTSAIDPRTFLSRMRSITNNDRVAGTKGSLRLHTVAHRHVLRRSRLFLLVVQCRSLSGWFLFNVRCCLVAWTGLNPRTVILVGGRWSGGCHAGLLAGIPPGMHKLGFRDRLKLTNPDAFQHSLTHASRRDGPFGRLWVKNSCSLLASLLGAARRTRAGKQSVLQHDRRGFTDSTFLIAGCRGIVAIARVGHSIKRIQSCVISTDASSAQPVCNVKSPAPSPGRGIIPRDLRDR